MPDTKRYTLTRKYAISNALKAAAKYVGLNGGNLKESALLDKRGTTVSDGMH